MTDRPTDDEAGEIARLERELAEATEALLIADEFCPSPQQIMQAAR